MIRQLTILLLLFLTACGTTSSEKIEQRIQSSELDTNSNTHQVFSPDSNITIATPDNDNATFYVVVADTSSDYYLLNKKMLNICKVLGISIDTMGRFYNEAKNLIALPDDAEDELYAGDYYPRRFPSDNLSLEYLSFYQDISGEKTIAIVRGIYETENGADSTLAVLKSTEKGAYKIKSEIYVGCIH